MAIGLLAKLVTEVAKTDVGKEFTKKLEGSELKKTISVIEQIEKVKNMPLQQLEYINDKIVEEKANEIKKGLIDEEKSKIKEETGWSDEIVDAIGSIEEYEAQKEEIKNNPNLTDEQKETYLKQCDAVIVAIKNGTEKLSNQEKGNFGEMCTDLDMLKKGYIRISDGAVSDLSQNLKTGIDGVYENLSGNIIYFIADSKYGSSQLQYTQDGKQLSDTWIDRRLDEAVGKEKADEIRFEQIENPENVGVFIAHIDENGNVSYETVDSDGNTVKNKEVFQNE